MWLMISHTFLPISSFTHLRRRTIFFAQRNNLNDNKIFTSNMSRGHFPILLSSYELVRDQAMWKGINRFVLKKLWKMSAGFVSILFCSWWSRGCIMETIFLHIPKITEERQSDVSYSISDQLGRDSSEQQRSFFFQIPLHRCFFYSFLCSIIKNKTLPPLHSRYPKLNVLSKSSSHSERLVQGVQVPLVNEILQIVLAHQRNRHP